MESDAQARLGELLIAAGLLTAEQVEQALRAQVMWGGRLGTNLDRARMPRSRRAVAGARSPAQAAGGARPALRARPTRELQQRLSPDLAERFSCVPLLRIGPETTTS